MRVSILHGWLLTLLALCPSQAFVAAPPDAVRFTASSNLASSTKPETMHTKEMMFSPEATLGINHVNGFVTYVIPGTQADSVGVKAGWQIVKINDDLTMPEDLAKTFKKVKSQTSDFSVTFDITGKGEELKDTKKKKEQLDAGWQSIPAEVGPSPPPAKITVSAKPRGNEHTITRALEQATRQLTNTLNKLNGLMTECDGRGKKQCPMDAPDMAAAALHELSQTAIEGYKNVRSFQMEEADRVEVKFNSPEAEEHERRRKEYMEDIDSYFNPNSAMCDFNQMTKDMWYPLGDLTIPIHAENSYEAVIEDCATICCSSQNCYGFGYHTGDVQGSNCVVYYEEFRARGNRDDPAVLFFLRSTMPPGLIAAKYYKPAMGCPACQDNEFGLPAQCQLAPFDEDRPIGDARPVCYAAVDTIDQEKCFESENWMLALIEAPGMAALFCDRDWGEFGECEDIKISATMLSQDYGITKIDHAWGGAFAFNRDNIMIDKMYPYLTNSTGVMQLVDWVDSQLPGVTVALALTFDVGALAVDGTDALNEHVATMTRSIGGSGNLPRSNHKYYTIVGFKGMQPGLAVENIHGVPVHSKIYCSTETDCDPITMDMKQIHDCTLPRLNADNCHHHYTNTTMGGMMYNVPCRMDTMISDTCMPDISCAVEKKDPAPAPTKPDLTDSDVFFLACWEYDAPEAVDCTGVDEYQLHRDADQIVNPTCENWASQGYCSSDSYGDFMLKQCAQSCCLLAKVDYAASSYPSKGSYPMNTHAGRLDCANICKMKMPEANYFFIGPQMLNEQSRCYCSEEYDPFQPLFGRPQSKPVQTEGKFGWWMYKPAPDAKCDAQNQVGNVGSTYGPTHRFSAGDVKKPFTSNFFISTGSGSCSPYFDAAKDADFFCTSMYGEKCAAASYKRGSYRDAPEDFGWQMSVGKKCLNSGGIEIDGTTCHLGKPCEIHSTRADHEGLYNIVCECNGGAQAGNLVNIFQYDQDIRCSGHEDCARGFYCDNSSSCYDQSLCYKAKDSIDGKCPDTLSPTMNPTAHPTNPPTSTPTVRPTQLPTLSPTRVPTMQPTMQPTLAQTTLSIDFSTRQGSRIMTDEVLLAIESAIKEGLMSLGELDGYNVDVTHVINFRSDQRKPSRDSEFTYLAVTTPLLGSADRLIVAEFMTVIIDIQLANVLGHGSKYDIALPRAKDSDQETWTTITQSPSSAPSPAPTAPEPTEYTCYADMRQDRNVKEKKRGILAVATAQQLTDQFAELSEANCFFWCQLNAPDFKFFELWAKAPSKKPACHCYDLDLRTSTHADSGFSFCERNFESANKCYTHTTKSACPGDICEWKQQVCAQTTGCDFTKDMQDLHCSLLDEDLCSDHGCEYSRGKCSNTLKAKNIKCGRLDMNGCCHVPGCYVDGKKCKGDFSGWQNRR